MNYSTFVFQEIPHTKPHRFPPDMLPVAAACDMHVVRWFPPSANLSTLIALRRKRLTRQAQTARLLASAPRDKIYRPVGPARRYLRHV